MIAENPSMNWQWIKRSWDAMFSIEWLPSKRRPWRPRLCNEALVDKKPCVRLPFYFLSLWTNHSPPHTKIHGNSGPQSLLTSDAPRGPMQRAQIDEIKQAVSQKSRAKSRRLAASVRHQSWSLWVAGGSLAKLPFFQWAQDEDGFLFFF